MVRLRWASEIAALSLLVTTGCAPSIYPVDRAPNWVISTGDWIAPPEDFAACFQGAHSQLQLLEACMLARGYRIRRAGDRAYAVPGPNAWFIKVAPDSNYPGATTGFAGVKGVAFYSRDECASWKAPASLTVLSGCHAVVVLNRPTTDSVSTPRGAEVVWRPKDKGIIFRTQEQCDDWRARSQSPAESCVSSWLFEASRVGGDA
jgi:hypothetical protein